MITSNIDNILLQHDLKIQEETNTASGFIDSLGSSLQVDDTLKDDSLTYENIKGMSLEEIDTIFKDEESQQMAKNLRLATLFTQDSTLGQAMFNTVLGQPFELGYTYLFDRYEDKNSFLNTSSSNSLADLLHSSISNKLDDGDKKVTDVISQDRLDEILLEVNSFDFVSSLSSTSRDQYGKYKDDEDNDYSFLYNDYALQYEELAYKYQEIDTYNKNIIKQF